MIKAKAGAEILEVVVGLEDNKDEKAGKRLPVTLNKHLKPAWLIARPPCAAAPAARAGAAP